MKNNPESGEFCCLHICLFNNGKSIHFRTTLTPASSFSLVQILEDIRHSPMQEQLLSVRHFEWFNVRQYFS